MLTAPVQPNSGTCTRGTRVSSSPSKIPYGEFSPVRLQTGIPPRPSSPRSGCNLHSAEAYTQLKSRSRRRALIRSRTRVQAALFSSDRTLPSRGPWLASGLYCPSGSTLTMTSSETLGSSGPTYEFAVRSILGREVPQFALPVSFLRAVFRTPVDQTTAPGCSFIVCFGLPHLCRGSASASHAFRFQRGPVTRLQSSLYATARKNCWPCTGQGVYVRAFTSRVASRRRRIYYAGKSANSRGRTCTGKTSSIMGCEQRHRDTEKKGERSHEIPFISRRFLTSSHFASVPLCLCVGSSLTIIPHLLSLQISVPQSSSLSRRSPV
jgi:hypothetical protein